MTSSTKPTVLVTGCSKGGIGNALVREYYSKGFSVFATARRLESMDDLEPLSTSGDVHLLTLDVSNLESIQAARDKVSEITGGKLDILVNNAGQAYSGPALDASLQEIRKMFDSNLFGVMSTVQEFSALLIASKRGKIVNIGSVAALVPLPFLSAYSASKAALHAYSDTLRVELKPFDVDVITVAAGGVHTNMTSRPPSPLSAESRYNPISDLVSKKQAETGQSMDAPTFAKKIVSDTTPAHPSALIFRGSSSTLAWFLRALLPNGAVRYIVSRMYGVDQLKGRLQKAKNL